MKILALLALFLVPVCLADTIHFTIIARGTCVLDGDVVVKMADVDKHPDATSEPCLISLKDGTQDDYLFVFLDFANQPRLAVEVTPTGQKVLWRKGDMTT